MFTKGTYEALGIFYQVCEKSFAYPYTWDGKSLQSASSFRVAIFAAATCYYVVSCAHLVFNVIGMLAGFLVVDSRQAFFNLSYAAWYVVASTFSFQMFYYRKEMLAFAKELLRVNDLYKSRYMVDKNKRMPRDHSELLIRLSTLSTFGGAPCYGILMFWYVDDYRYFYRFILPYTGSSWWIVGIFGVWEVCILFTSWGVMQFCWFLFMLHCTSCRFWIEQLTGIDVKREGGSRSTTCASMPFDDRVTMYRQLQVLNAEYNRLNRWFFAIGLKLSTVIIDAQSIYCFVLLYGVIVFFMYVCFSSMFVCFSVIILVTYSMAGEVYQSTFDFRRLLLLHHAAGNGLKQCRTSARSLSPFGISVGSLYQFERKTTLSVIAIVSNLSTNAIIMSLSRRRNNSQIVRPEAGLT